MTININEVPTSIPTVSGDDLVAQVEAARDQAQTAAALSQSYAAGQRPHITPLPRLAGLLDDVQAGLVRQLRAICWLDSIAFDPWYHLVPYLQSRVRSKYLGNIAASNNDFVTVTAVIASVDHANTASVVTGQYSQWHTGEIGVYAVGDHSFQRGGGHIRRTQIRAALIVQSGGGVAQWKVDGVLVGTPVDTSVGAPGSVIFLDEPASASEVNTSAVLTVTGAAVRVAYIWSTLASANMLEVHTLLAKGGLALGDFAGYPQTLANLQAVVTAINPHLHTWAAKESSADLAEDAAISKFFDVLDAASSRPDVIVCSECPVTTNDAVGALVPEHNALLLAEVRRRQGDGKSYAYVDLYSQFGETWEAARDFVNGLGADYKGDGVHLAPKGIAAFYKPVVDLVDNVCRARGGSDQAPWTNQPIKTGLGSVVGAQYTQWSDIGIEWRRAAYDNYSLLGLFGGRSLRLQGGGGTDVFQLRGTYPGIGSEYSVNILPASWQFGTWNSAQSLEINTNYGGLAVVNFGDTGVGNGGAILRVGAFVPRQMSKAQALALAAEITVAGYYFGTQIGVGDAANGWPLWVAVSNGAGGLKWVDSRDGATVLS